MCTCLQIKSTMNFSEKVSAKLDVQPVADITHAWQHCKDNGRPPAPAPSCCCCSLFPTALPHNGNCKYRARYTPVGSPARWSVNPVGKESVSLHARCVPGALDSARSREGLRETETRKCGFTHSARYLFFTLREHFLKSGGKRVKVISLLKSNGKCCLRRKSRCDVHGHAGLCLERRPRGLTCSTWSGGHPAGLSSRGKSGPKGVRETRSEDCLVFQPIQAGVRWMGLMKSGKRILPTLLCKVQSMKACIPECSSSASLLKRELTSQGVNGWANSFCSHVNGS